MDIAILGDRSKTMNTWRRNKLISLVNSLVDNLGVSSAGNHFAIGAFGPSSTLYNNFKNAFYHNAKNVKAVARKRFSYVPKDLGTRPDIALNKAATNLFVPWAGDRENAKNVLVVFYDGRFSFGKKDKKDFIPFWKSTKALEVLEF